MTRKNEGGQGGKVRKRWRAGLAAAVFLAALCVISAVCAGDNGTDDGKNEGSILSDSPEGGFIIPDIFSQPDEEQVSVLDESTINCWGDSMTQGINGDGISYPDILEQLTGIKTNNFGIAGENTLEITERSAEYGDQSNDIMIIEMGDNGGWDSLPELISQYQEMIETAGCDRYIIITSTDDPDDPDSIWYEPADALGITNTSYEQALVDAFGDHVFLARRYLLMNGLKLNGLKAGKSDYHRAFAGDISEQLRHVELDNTHLNGYGYTAQAIGVYAKGVELGYWPDTGVDIGLSTTEDMEGSFFTRHGFLTK
ncbi:MAG: SGNH/GDSL hydrolase family protein [Lachnospiraceae bacterium]|nr:SGNH/GDSL hydrolase family protein [Lachnospiraceae bacterium]